MAAAADENGDRAHQLAGAAGRDRIKRMMSQGNPTQAIADFSAENSLDMPAADAIYALLDSLGHTRREVHGAALEAAVLAAQKQIQTETLPQDKYLALLGQIVHYLDVPQLQHLPLLLLSRRPQLLSADIRQKIHDSPELYSKCSGAIKRELWHKYHDLFRGHMVPLIRSYVQDSDLLWMSREITDDASAARSEKRRANAALVDIIRAIGDNLQFYMQTLGMVREMFLETNDPALGTLRLDLVMAVHDKGLSEITSDDLCYGLAWPLDACINKQSMDDRRVLELQRFFDRIDRNNAPYGEIGLILCSPYSRHILAQHILAILEEVALGPGVHDRAVNWRWPYMMLSMGLAAHTMIGQENPEIPKASIKAIRRFLESLYPFIEAAHRHDRAQQDDVSSSIKRVRLNHQGSFGGSASSAGRPTATMEDYRLSPASEDVAVLESEEYARQVVYAFVLKRATNLDLGMVNVWLPVVADILPAVLGLPAEDAQSRMALDPPAESPAPPEIALPLRIAAFEADAFIQSLISRIGTNNSAIAAVLNQVCAEMDQAQQGTAIEAMSVPLVRLLVRSGRARHCAHEQTVAFLAACTRLIAAEYNNGAPGPATAEAPGGHGLVSNKESAVYFVFQFVEHAAAYNVVDPAQAPKLKRLYAKLAAASPQQAFAYRICRANCPRAARFLDG
ncbi:hypothetical protein H4R18_004863 [Coemansia javaensis]|uniref:Uncharacterized protein n=1 Tax=Coemansia javaensis TaxID=2761396 RepID=A0A9W8LFP0_9FUNG|nr:hypothetical protein H4R18_004863 [Coemansia javaensis]